MYQFGSVCISMFSLLEISLREIDKIGNRNPDSVFGVLANEIFGQNSNLNDRLNLYVNLKQNRNGFKDPLVDNIVHHMRNVKFWRLKEQTLVVITTNHLLLIIQTDPD